MPNLTPIPSGTDPAQVTAMMNRNFQQLNNEQVTKLYNDQNGTPSILMGLDSSGKSVIKVAKTGVDVTKATDAQLAFNSAQNTLKVVASGAMTVTALATGTTYSDSVPHGLSYIPILVATVTNPFSGTTTPCPYFSILNSGTVQWSASIWATATDVNFQVSVTTAGGAGQLGAYTFHYYALQETATV